MSDKIITRLDELSIQLPDVKAPIASYVPIKKSDSLLFISGQLPFKDNKIIFPGKVGKDVTLDNALLSAEICIINMISLLRTFLNGKLEDVKQFIKISGYVACDSNFTEHHIIMNGASDLIVKVFGQEIGKHSRLAIGCPSLPLNAPLEIEGIIEIR